MPSFLYEVILCLIFISTINSVSSISCFQCNSTDHSDPFQCGEYMTDDIDIDPKPCDSVYGAAYCIKHTGRFEVIQLIDIATLKHISSCMMNMVASVCACCFHGLAYGIHCYQCASATNIDCSNELIHDTLDSSLEPTSCSFLFEARYCVKATGLHSGGLGTKRFCSSLDLGNYCNYIRQPGDVMEYRSCVYTCDSDGCNTGSNYHQSHFINIFITITLSISLIISKMSFS